MSNDEFEFIDDNSEELAHRGRPSSIDPSIVKMLASAPKGKRFKVASLAGDISDHEAFKRHKQNANAKLHSAGKSAGLKLSIRWTLAGVPTVAVVIKGK